MVSDIKLHQCTDVALTWPINAIVKPANAPPRRTRPTATARYIHNLALCGGNGCGSPDVENGFFLVGAAPNNGKFRKPNKRSFAAENSAGVDIADLGDEFDFP